MVPHTRGKHGSQLWFSYPSGLVSLNYLDAPVHGLSHTHHRAPARAHFLGTLSPDRDPVTYTGAIEELLGWHTRRHPAVPLIINTCGWIKARSSAGCCPD
jgi:polynucleotide 5'-hydroxyl-kinase GRC3/NOL9